MKTDSTIVTGQAGGASLIGPVIVSAVYITKELSSALISHVQSIENNNLEYKENLNAIVPIETIILPPTAYNKLLKETQDNDKVMTWIHSRAIRTLLKCYGETNNACIGNQGPLDSIKASLGKSHESLTVHNETCCFPEALRAARIFAAKIWANHVRNLLDIYPQFRYLQKETSIDNIDLKLLKKHLSPLKDDVIDKIFKTHKLSKL